MDKISDAIKCFKCMNILSTPIILPCGHSICKVHCDVSDKEIICPRCGLSHPNSGFIVNLGLANIISSRVGSFDFGSSHKRAKKACDKLEEVLVQIRHILIEPCNYSNTVIDEMKKKVLLKSEQLKLELEENTKKLIEILDLYEKECENNLNEPSCISNIARFESSKNESEKQLKEWYAVLNELKVDENKWKSIKEECDKKVVQLNKELNDFRIQLLMTQYEERNAHVTFFSNVNLNSILKLNYINCDSIILTQNQKTELRNLCQITLQTEWKLLYRGSRDGYGASDFHSKCDNIAKTLTIIETTDGYIFGGYTELTWNSNNFGRCYNQVDKNSYIFSLVNRRNSSVVMKIVNMNSSIRPSSSNGPVFGNGDITICNNSNNSRSSCASVNSYRPPDNFTFDSCILAGSNYFQVKEIEVFQLITERSK